MKKLAVLASALLLSVSVHAEQDVAGVTLPADIKLAGDTLDFQGAGVRSKFFIDLYVGSLFSTNKSIDVVKSDKTSAVRLNIISGLITSEKMVTAINDGFESATGGDIEPIKQEIADFIAVFSDKIVKGDQFTLLSMPGKGLQTYKNGELLADTKNDVFRQAVLSIWLGENPADEDLKEEMLGL